MQAVFSECGLYRYRLERHACESSLVFLMLNPSTADASEDDPTIRRCRRFANDLGYDGVVVVNLYAYRATNPGELKLVDDPIGPENDAFIRHACSLRDVVCAWGNNADHRRVNEVFKILKDCGCNPYCLGKTKTGMPKHPLYLRADSELVTYHYTIEASVLTR